jgi:hypothetical protein
MAETASAFSGEDEDHVPDFGNVRPICASSGRCVTPANLACACIAFAFGGATGSVVPSRAMLDRAVVWTPDTETDAVAPFTILAQKRRFSLPTMNGVDPMSIRLSWRSEYPSPSK